MNQNSSVTTHKNGCLKKPGLHRFARPLLIFPHAASPDGSASARRADFDMLDELLSRSADKEAEVVSFMQLHQESFKSFGSRLYAVPKRIYNLEELRLNKIETTAILSPADTELNNTRNIALAAFASLVAAVAIGSGGNMGQVLALLVASTFLFFLDTIAYGGQGETLIVDTLGGLLFSSYRERVALHEAGHILVAYYCGILPKAITLSSLDTLLRYKSLGIQAGTLFLDSEFQIEVSKGKLSSSSLDKYTCICLAGVIAEYLCFGRAEGGVNDIRQLDALFRAIGFSQAKSDGEVRWAVLNCAFILREKAALHKSIAEAIKTQAPTIGQLVKLIESDSCASIKA